ncbi:MAG TPA: hypothetical protein DCY52_00770 [Methylococcaceae bacterium]|nr:hypothetical protein [Methylococcaceae bacterium]
MCESRRGKDAMPKNAGRDQRTRAKFKITGVDEANGLVLLHHAKDGWTDDPEGVRAMPWAEFVRNLMEGWYELHPTKDPTTSL